MLSVLLKHLIFALDLVPWICRVSTFHWGLELLSKLSLFNVFDDIYVLVKDLIVALVLLPWNVGFYSHYFVFSFMYIGVM